ncbi:MAG TPA: AbrB/MazE/SpoVT family DNA-binding domain-containing protein [bacterium]
MSTQVSKIDKQGRIQLPEKMREKSGLLPETDVLIELRDDGIFIKPKLTTTPITQRIAEMDLPVSDWEKMEAEIAEGHLK